MKAMFESAQPSGVDGGLVPAGAALPERAEPRTRARARAEPVPEPEPTPTDRKCSDEENPGSQQEAEGNWRSASKGLSVVLNDPGNKLRTARCCSRSWIISKQRAKPPKPPRIGSSTFPLRRRLS